MDKRKNHQILVKALCVVASFALWLYISNSENPIEDYPLEVPVAIVGEEKLGSNLVLERESQYSVDLKLKGPRSELNNVKSSQFKLEADISGFAIIPGQSYNIPVKVKEQPLPGVVYVQDSNLFIKVKFDELVEKNLPVKAELNITPKSGYALLSEDIKPTSVVVSGPSKYISTIDHVKVRYDGQDVDKDIVASRPLQPVDKAGNIVSQVNVSPQSADIFIPVRKTKTVGVNIITKGSMGKDLILKSKEAVPDKIDIAGEPNVLDAISMLDTEPIDLTTLTSTKTVELKLIVPNNLTLVNSKGMVNVKLSVEKQAQKNFSVDIKFNNLGAEYNITTDKAKVSLVITGPESKVNSLVAEDIKCYIDLANLSEGDGHTLPVVVNVPEGLVVTSANPQTVKATISKKVVTNNSGAANGSTSGNGTTPTNTTPTQPPTTTNPPPAQ